MYFSIKKSRISIETHQKLLTFIVRTQNEWNFVKSQWIWSSFLKFSSKNIGVINPDNSLQHCLPVPAGVPGWIRRRCAWRWPPPWRSSASSSTTAASPSPGGPGGARGEFVYNSMASKCVLVWVYPRTLQTRYLQRFDVSRYNTPSSLV